MRWPFDGFRHVREHLIAFYPLPDRNVAPDGRPPVRRARRLSAAAGRAAAAVDFPTIQISASLPGPRNHGGLGSKGFSASRKFRSANGPTARRLTAITSSSSRTGHRWRANGPGRQRRADNCPRTPSPPNTQGNPKLAILITCGDFGYPAADHRSDLPTRSQHNKSASFRLRRYSSAASEAAIASNRSSKWAGIRWKASATGPGDRRRSKSNIDGRSETYTSTRSADPDADGTASSSLSRGAPLRIGDAAARPRT